MHNCPNCGTAAVVGAGRIKTCEVYSYLHAEVRQGDTHNQPQHQRARRGHTGHKDMCEDPSLPVSSLAFVSTTRTTIVAHVKHPTSTSREKEANGRWYTEAMIKTQQNNQHDIAAAPEGKK